MQPATRYVLRIACLACALSFSPGHAESRGEFSHDNRDILSTGEKMVLDAVVLRPIGLITTVAGTAIYTVSLPFSLLGGNEEEVREHLVKEPARYTFKRALGDIHY
mgnify:CR=1 FL=1|tara:strand:+ start:1302 stop:1619 length:318 start_codon:yes stop_codon:yes gene_type:complete